MPDRGTISSQFTRTQRGDWRGARALGPSVMTSRQLQRCKGARSGSTMTWSGWTWDGFPRRCSSRPSSTRAESDRSNGAVTLSSSSSLRTGRNPGAARTVSAPERIDTGLVTNGPLPRTSMVSPSLAPPTAAARVSNLRSLPTANRTKGPVSTFAGAGAGAGAASSFTLTTSRPPLAMLTSSFSSGRRLPSFSAWTR